MASRKAGGITWNISVNSAGARTQISLLKRQIREANREWRNQSNSLIANGRYTDALKVKEQGLTHVQELLKSAIGKTDTMLNHSSQDSGTRKYQQTAVDVKSFRDQLDKTGTQLTTNERKLELHNDALRNTSRDERNAQEIGRSRIAELQAEGRETEASSAKYRNYGDQLQILKRREEALNSTINRGQRDGLDQYGSGDFSKLIAQLHKVRAAESELQEKQHDIGTGLTHDAQYNDLYNQSTNKVVASLRRLKRSTEANRVEYNRLSQNIGSESNVLNLEAQKAGKIADASGKDSIAFQREQSKLTSLSSKYQEHINRINELGPVYNHMTSQVSAGIDRQKAKIHDLNLASHHELSVAHSLAGTSFALGSAFIYGTKQAMGLENEFNRVKNLLNTSGESMKQAGSEIRQMGHDTQQMSVQYGVSQKEIANGYEALARRGYTGKQALASQKYYLQGTIASGDKYNDVMHTAASTLEAFNMRSNKTGTMVGNTKRVVNQLAYAADLTATDFKGIGYGMQYVGDTAHNAHQSLSETSSALGVLSNRGENATVAATGLRKILLALSTIKNSKNKGALSKIGLSPSQLYDSKGNLKSLSSVFDILNSHMKNMSSTQKSTVFKSLFGTTGINSAFALSQSTGQLKSLNKQVAKSQDQSKGQGYVAKIARRNMNSTQMQMKRLKEAGTLLAQTYAQGLNPAFKRLAAAGLKVVTVFSKAPKPLKDLAAIGTTIVPVIAGLNFGLAAFNKVHALTISNSLKMLGISKNEQSQLKNKINTTNDSTEATDKNNASIMQSIRLHRQQQEVEQQDSNSENSDTNSENANTEADKTNTNAVEVNANADQTLAERHSYLGNWNNATGGSIGTGMAGTAMKNYGKAGLAGGAIVGGTEMLSGNISGGAEDAIGTTGGTALGGVIAGPAGAAIGSVAGPIIARSVSKPLGQGLQNLHKSYVRSQEPRVPQSNSVDIRNARNFNRDLKGISNSSQSFVRSESALESRVTKQIAEDGGKIKGNVVSTYNRILSLAQSYGSRELKTKDSSLKKLYNNGLLNGKQYNKALNNAKNDENKNIRQIQAIHHRLVTSDRRTDSRDVKQRERDLSSLNKYLLRLTNAGYKRQEKLKRDLYNSDSKLNEKQYARVLKLRNRNYNDTVNEAKKKYKVQKSSLRNELNTLKHGDRSQRALYKIAYRNAYKGRHSVLREDQKRETDAIHDARKERNGVTKATDARVSHSIKAAYRHKQRIEALDREHHEKTLQREKRYHQSESQNQSEYFKDMDRDIKGFFSGIVHLISHLPHPSIHFRRRAIGTPDTRALHLALGNLPGISKDENAVINDGNGRELVKLPNGQLVLPSGRNVHTILPRGTSVFNAMQTRKLLSMASSLQNPIQHHANGTDDTGTLGVAGIASDDNKHGFNIDTMRGNVRDAKKAASDIHDAVDQGYKDTSDDANKHLQDLHDNSDSLWDDTRKLTKKHVSDIHDDTKGRTKDLRDTVDKFEKQTESWSNSHLGTTVKYFKKHFNMIPPITRSSMKSGVSNINAGIGAIDRVLSEFGGNSHVLSAVHYAAGTSGPPMKKQLAILNDATSGPQQEAVVSDQGRVRIPKGRNVPTILNPGDRVLNGSDTLKALKTGLIPHYAKGKESGEALYKLAEHYAKYPSNFINGTLNNYTSLIGDNLTRGITNAVKQGSQHPADNWSNAMWKYINSIINASSSEFLNYAQQFGRKVHYVYGANGGNNAYDCSSFVDACLRHFNVDGLPRVSNAIISHFQPISRSQARPGDLLGTSEHIGIVADNGAHKYYSNHGPEGHHPAASTTPYEPSAFPGGAAKFARVPQLAQYNSDSGVNNNPLTSLVKNELGSNAIKWIKDHVSNDMDISNPSGDTVQRWIPAVKQALSKLNLSTGESTVSRVLRQINTESSGNPYAVGGTDGLNDGRAMGLMQVKPGTFSAYGDPKLGSWHNGYASIYAGLNYAKHRYGDSLSFLGEGHGYANGGLSVGDKIAHISEGNRPEMVLPLTDKSRAVALMLKSLQYMFGNDKGNSNQRNNQSQQQYEREQLLQDRRFEQELIQSNRNKDHMIQHILDKMTLLIRTVQQKPVISNTDIYNANRSVNMRKLRLRNLNRGTF